MKRRWFFVVACLAFCCGLLWIGQANAQDTRAQCQAAFNGNLQTIRNEFNSRITYAQGLLAKYRAQLRATAPIRIKVRQDLQAKIDLYQSKHDAMVNERRARENAARGAYNNCLAHARR